MRKLKALVLFVATWVSFVVLFYLLKLLADAGQQIFEGLNKGALNGIGIFYILVITWAMLVSAGIAFILQFLKSIFDVAAKKMCDEAA